MENRLVKAVFFDFMGTCLDWHSGVLSTFPQSIPENDRSELALQWRQLYFNSNSARLKSGQDPEDIDITLRNTLHALLDIYPQHRAVFDQDTISRCVVQWHSMPAWPDVPPAITKLREMGLEVFVFANGTPRLQLDLCKSSGLKFDMLFSSALLGVYKPALVAYEKTLELTKFRPQETVMVAAHAYDLRGAQAAKMKTVYIKRWTDDIEEDKQRIGEEFDHCFDNMSTLPTLLSSLQV